MRVIGIDPGLDGAVAVLDASTRRVVAVVDCPTIQHAGSSKRQFDAGRMAVALREQSLGHDVTAVLEHARAMPGQGVT